MRWFFKQKDKPIKTEPSTLSQTSFHQFQELPAELRVKVWQFVLSHIESTNKPALFAYKRNLWKYNLIPVDGSIPKDAIIEWPYRATAFRNDTEFASNLFFHHGLLDNVQSGIHLGAVNREARSIMLHWGRTKAAYAVDEVKNSMSSKFNPKQDILFVSAGELERFTLDPGSLNYLMPPSNRTQPALSLPLALSSHPLVTHQIPSSRLIVPWLQARLARQQLASPDEKFYVPYGRISVRMRPEVHRIAMVGTVAGNQQKYEDRNWIQAVINHYRRLEELNIIFRSDPSDNLVNKDSGILPRWELTPIPEAKLSTAEADMIRLLRRCIALELMLNCLDRVVDVVPVIAKQMNAT